MSIPSVNQEQVIEILNQNNPDWHLQYASRHQLLDVARGYIKPIELKERVIRDFWPVCCATWEAIIKSSK